MSGKYEEEVILYPRIHIEAYRTDIGFASLFRWLDENDRRLEGHAKFVRTLHIHLDLISLNSASPLARLYEQRTTSPCHTHEKVDNALWALELCCRFRWAQKGDDELRNLESTLPKFNPFKKSSDDDRTRRRVQTRSGKGYLVFCSAQTIHAHQPSEVEPGLSKAYFCRKCAYIGYLVNEFLPDLS